MRAKRDGEIPHPVPDTSQLRILPQARLQLDRLATGEGLATADVEAWHRGFNDALRQAVPYGNPNVLKLKLPIPKEAKPEAAAPSREDWARAAVDWYVRPQAVRMCELDPTDNECLSNAEMETLVADLVRAAGG